MKKDILTVKSLESGYNNFTLKNINFSVKPNEFIGIIGPNGSGKTTLLKSITRLLKPKKGQIFFEDFNVWEMSNNIIAKNIAVVTQNNDLNHMNVFDFILLGRIPYFKRMQLFETKHDREIAEKYMKLTDTYKYKDKTIDKLSGGERQLIYITRALTQEPELLLLDEPTAHLDISHKITILDLIKKLNKELTLTVLIVLHDLNLASEYCDRIILLNNGKIFQIGNPDEVLKYNTIEEVYNTVVIIDKNPVSKKPYVFFVSEEYRKKIL
jgi:iron complex transport system ATP-binding protein